MTQSPRIRHATAMVAAIRAVTEFKATCLATLLSLKVAGSCCLRCQASSQIDTHYRWLRRPVGLGQQAAGRRRRHKAAADNPPAARVQTAAAELQLRHHSYKYQPPLRMHCGLPLQQHTQCHRKKIFSASAAASLHARQRKVYFRVRFDR